MKDFATKYLEKYNGFSKIVKILLCLLWDVPSTLYRLSKSALKDNTLGIVLAIVLGICGGWILFIIDILTLALKDKLLWLDDLGIDEGKMAESLKSEEEAPSEAEEKAEEKSEEQPEEKTEEQPESEEKPEEAEAEQPAEETPAVDGEVED